MIVNFNEGGAIITYDGLQIHISKSKALDLAHRITEYFEWWEDGRGIEEICNKKDCYADEYINGHCQKCLNCIKQYFIRKVENEAAD